MNIFKIALPGSDIKSNAPGDSAVNGLYSSPKIDTRATPPHAGIIYLNWTNATPIPQGTTKVIYSFPHGYSYIPTAIAAYKFDNGTRVLRATLPFTVGGLAVITIDTDKTNVYLKYFSLDPGSNPIPPFLMQIRFYVMAERGKT